MVHHLQHISEIVNICCAFGVHDVVISPGSRNAPLIQGFTAQGSVTCHSIPDERVAGYFALGLALERQNPVIVITTSGTATLNLAPAVAEAFYQHIPLIVITADRPGDVVETQQNQTIPQQEIFNGFIKKNINVSAEDFKIKSLISTLETAVQQHKGPVHINVPIMEPLYISLPGPELQNPAFATAKSTTPAIPEELLSALEDSEKVMIICGQNKRDEDLNEVLNAIAKKKNAVVLAEAISNISGEGIFSETDPLVAAALASGEEEYLPDLLISTGGHVVSKRFLLWMQKYPEIRHWRIADAPDQIDTYGNLTGIVAGRVHEILSELFKTKTHNNTYFTAWSELSKGVSYIAEQAIFDLHNTEMKAFALLMMHLPINSNLHLGNGSIVRYAQMFPVEETITVYSNRGVSGIDGSLSTAAGISRANPSKKNILLIGDMSFIYDSNAMWNRDFPENLTIIVINNNGGGIFRLIDGPDKHEWFEPYQVAHHNTDLKKLTEAFNIEYKLWIEEGEIIRGMSELSECKIHSVIEIKTNPQHNDASFKLFYENIKQQI